MFKRGKVVMLPTNGKQHKMLNEHLQVQHFYITSNEEIKEGDWCINGLDYLNERGAIIQIRQNDVESANYYKNVIRKIIATTNDSLSFHLSEDIEKLGAEYSLPQPSQSFIEKYVEEYNKGNIITDVMVECIDWEDKPSDIHSTMGESNWATLNIGKPKINSKDNTITIRKVKDSWNKEEIKQLCWMAYINHKCVNGKIAPDKAEALIEDFNKWFEKNI